MTFIDFKKAFDSISRGTTFIWNGLRRFGTLVKIINLVQTFYYDVFFCHEKNYKYTYRWTDILEDIDYTDELCVLAHKFTDMIEKLEELEEDERKLDSN